MHSAPGFGLMVGGSLLHGGGPAVEGGNPYTPLGIAGSSAMLPYTSY